MKTIQVEKQVIYVAGLPRAGSTLMCHLLGLHPQIYSQGQSSGLCHLVTEMRSVLSKEPFVLSQLDVEFDEMYNRLLNAYRGLFNGWFADAEQPFVVDKNRDWVALIETLHLIDPNFKLVICIRDLGQIFGSIEAQHRKTLLLEFPNPADPNFIYRRADYHFGPDRIVGRHLEALRNLQDLDSPELNQHIAYVDFDTLVSEPVQTMNTLYQRFGLPESTFDPQNIPLKPAVTDSHYRFKYPHQLKATITPPKAHRVPPRIMQQLRQNFAWFYQMFYPSGIRN